MAARPRPKPKAKAALLPTASQLGGGHGDVGPSSSFISEPHRVSPPPPSSSSSSALRAPLSPPPSSRAQSAARSASPEKATRQHAIVIDDEDDFFTRRRAAGSRRLDKGKARAREGTTAKKVDSIVLSENDDDHRHPSASPSRLPSSLQRSATQHSSRSSSSSPSSSSLSSASGSGSDTDTERRRKRKRKRDVVTKLPSWARSQKYALGLENDGPRTRPPPSPSRSSQKGSPESSTPQASDLDNEREQSASVTPPPKLPDAVLLQSRNGWRQILAHRTSAETTDNVSASSAHSLADPDKLDPELARILQQVQAHVHSAGSSGGAGHSSSFLHGVDPSTRTGHHNGHDTEEKAPSGEDVVEDHVKTRIRLSMVGRSATVPCFSTATNPEKGALVDMGKPKIFLVNRHESFDVLYDAVAERTRIRRSHLVLMTQGGSLVYPSSTPESLGWWTAGDLVGCSRELYDFMQAEKRAKRQAHLDLLAELNGPSSASSSQPSGKSAGPAASHRDDMISILSSDEEDGTPVVITSDTERARELPPSCSPRPGSPPTGRTGLRSHATAEGTGGNVGAGVDADQDEEGLLRLTLRSKRGKDVRVTVKPTTLVSSVLQHFAQVSGLPAAEARMARIEFEGETVAPGTMFASTEVEDEDMLDVKW